MAMNFFEQQHVARRKTRWMILLFIAAVAGVVAAVDLFVGGAWLFTEYTQARHGYGYGAVHPVYSLAAVPRSLYAWGAIITLAVILLESVRQTVSLSEGGRVVAEAFGARRVDPGSRDPKERQLLNVVEEMAIASGVRVPAVYVLDGEDGINAFAAGHNVSDTVVTVTRGMLDALNRDELQGVIGHEFSHILNGDMALNIRLMGLLAGIVAIGSIGFFVMRVAARSDNSRSTVPLLAAGLALVFIGYSGLFFARLIKAAVSREREFLADASSVQFTRNPEGIASALDKVRTAAQGGLIHHRYAEEVSHMFFGQSIHPWLSGLFDTHPSLDERIQRIDPNFQTVHRARERIAARAGAGQGTPAAGTQPARGAGIPAMPEGLLAAGAIAGFAAGEAGRTGQVGPGAATGRATDPAAEWKTSPGAITGMVGAAGRVDAVQRLLAALPEGLRDRVHQPDGACALVVALMLAPRDDVREAQLAAARNAGADALADAAAGLEAQTRTLAAVFHLPLVDLALPAIKAAAPELRARFFKALEAVIYADRRVSPHEFVVLTLVRFQTHAGHAPPPIKYKTLDAVRDEALWVLSLVAHAGCLSRDEEGRQREFDAAFAAGAKALKLENATPSARADFSMEKAEAMLGTLRLLAPLRKAVLVQGLFAAIVADGKIRVIEAELMRLVCAVIDCPLPPLFDNFDTGSISG